MNFLFNDSSRTNKIVYYSFSALRRELGKGCARFPIHCGYRQVCAINTFSRDCYPLMLTAAFCSLPATVYRLLTTIFLNVSRLRVGP